MEGKYAAELAMGFGKALDFEHVATFPLFEIHRCSYYSLRWLIGGPASGTLWAPSKLEAQNALHGIWTWLQGWMDF